MKRTQEEIVAKYKEVQGEDIFGVMGQNLVTYLDFEHAEEFLNKDTTEEDFLTCIPGEELTPEGEMEDYMPFAFEKAQNQRGLSASRSMQHYKSWLWLAGEDELSEMMDDYTDYGVNNLREVCTYLGIDSMEHGDE